MHALTEKDLTAHFDPKVFKELFTLNPYKHVVATAYNWLIMAVTAYLYQQFPSYWLYPIVVIIIGARMHALTILMHDATHYRFLKNRRWNDLISNTTVMYPLFTSIDKYRANHLKHHQHLNTMDDPDWVAKLTKREFQFPKTKTAFLLTICSYMVLYQGILDAIWFMQRYGKAKDKSNVPSLGTKAPKVLFYLVLFSLVTLFGLWQQYLLFWIIPYLTSFFMFQYIRSVAEHFGELAYEDSLSSTRTVVTNPLEKFLVAPHHVSYHLEHHLYPGVPFYNLPKLHRLLMSQEQYRTEAHITNGYFSGLLNELGGVDGEG